MSFHSPIGRAGLGLDPGEAAREAAEHEREDRERSSAWASAITRALVEARPPLTLPSLPDAESTAEARAPRQEGVKNPTPSSVELRDSAAIESPETQGPELPNRLVAELSDSSLGRMELSVARGPSGLRIVINVADARVKALIEAEQALLLKSLQGSGLRVDSLQIAEQPEPGTGLAPQEGAEIAQQRALARSRSSQLRSLSARGRGYGAKPEEEPEDDTDRVDFTA
ncbi:MAG TPA: flagellar hook-length control protein FliK [Polyangiaceae bacterium]|nr:flagellar hook-length control protein FliK [Polyangiaceae bacterium]